LSAFFFLLSDDVFNLVQRTEWSLESGSRLG
jgi:hypothetical protein